VFTTPDGTKSGLNPRSIWHSLRTEACQMRCLEIDTRTLNQMGVKIPEATPVRRGFNMPGGGQEAIFDS
jgi:hypothetical protein